MDLDAVADELYGLPMAQFTQTRTMRAKELSASGEKRAADAVRKLRKPSQAAWLVNRLVRKHPQEVEKVLDLGRALRQAQSHAQGADLRHLSTSRQELVRRLLRLCSEEAGASGTSFGTEAQRQLVATLEAAMANESSGKALQAGRLTEALSHVGFGDAETTDRSDRLRPPPGRAVADAQAQMDSADTAFNRARQRHEQAKARRDEAADALGQAQRQLQQSSEELQQARARQKEMADALRAAERQRRRPTPKA